MKWSLKLFVVTLSLLLLVGLGVLVVYLDQQFSQSQWHGGREVALRGEVVCLPHKNEGDVHTMECAIGLKADDGKYYAMVDSSYYETNTHVEVTGLLTSPDVDSRYNISGTIEQAKIKKLE